MRVPHTILWRISLLLFSLSWANVQSLSGLEKDSIVPDLISVAPDEMCAVTYKDGLKVEGGNEIKPAQTKDMPTVKWNAKKDKFYTLILTDPDGPTRSKPDIREVLYWHVANVPGTDIGKGDTLVEYIGAGPPPGTGLHRFVYLIYEQPGKIDVKSHPRVKDNTVVGRIKFNSAEWASKYNLGNPVAGNFFYTQFDDWVPTLLKQIGLA